MLKTSGVSAPSDSVCQPKPRHAISSQTYERWSSAQSHHHGGVRPLVVGELLRARWFQNVIWWRSPPNLSNFNHIKSELELKQALSIQQQVMGALVGTWRDASETGHLQTTASTEHATRSNALKQVSSDLQCSLLQGSESSFSRRHSGRRLYYLIQTSIF